ncbi:MAG TPA: hypothetical protein ENH90_01755 [bacterium]|nr:hypothetical protein [bacterium]
MTSLIILVPDQQVFETAFFAHSAGDSNNSCLKLFREAWLYYVDKRHRLIAVSQELNTHLCENHYKSKKKKRQALFSCLEIHTNSLNCGLDKSQSTLASILSIEEDNEVYYVTDNDQMREAVTKLGLFEPASSKQAIELIKELG